MQYDINLAMHHRKKSFRDELIELLQNAEIEYDPKFLD